VRRYKLERGTKKKQSIPSERELREKMSKVKEIPYGAGS
jgi:hypothetical protein